MEYDPIADRWTERAAVPTARKSSAVAVQDEIIYVIGGSFGHRPLATVEAYNPRSDTWTTRTPMRTPRAFHSASAVGGLIYVFGGNETDEVEVYDPATDTWDVAGTMPARRSQFHTVTLGESIFYVGGSDGVNYLSSTMVFTPVAVSKQVSDKCPSVQETNKASMPTRRGGMAVGEIDGIIYVVGGYDPEAGHLATNEAYDPVADEWRIKSPMPTAREVMGTNTAISGGKFYVIGGNAKGYCSSVNEAYDPATDTWATRASMPTARCHGAVVALNGLIYAFGGTNTNGSIRYSVLEIYDPSTDEWKTGAPMPTSRHYIGAGSANGIIYAIGGWNPALTQDGTLDVVEAYDPARDTWTTMTSLPTPRNFPAVGVLDGLLIVVGGENEKTAVLTVDAYDPSANSWSTIASSSTPRIHHSSVTANNSLYVFGGRTALHVNESTKNTVGLTLSRCSGE